MSARKNWWIICDHCDAMESNDLVGFTSAVEGRDYAKAIGWSITSRGDFCPACVAGGRSGSPS